MMGQNFLTLLARVYNSNGSNACAKGYNPLSWKLRLLPGNLVYLMTLNQLAKTGITVLGGVNFPDHQGEMGSFYTTEGQEAYVWNAGILTPDLHLPCKFECSLLL